MFRPLPSNNILGSGRECPTWTKDIISHFSLQALRIVENNDRLNIRVCNKVDLYRSSAPPARSQLVNLYFLEALETRTTSYSVSGVGGVPKRALTT